jgi:hypothetical protein
LARACLEEGIAEAALNRSIPVTNSAINLSPEAQMSSLLPLIAAIRAFQRRFRPRTIDGEIGALALDCG